MLTGEIRNQIDGIWDDFWAGGIANPLSVIEQITYLLFLKRRDDLHTPEELKSQWLNAPMERRIYPEGDDKRGRPYEDLRWSRFKHFQSREMMEVVDEHVFPFLRALGGEGSGDGKHMRDARLGISNPFRKRLSSISFAAPILRRHSHQLDCLYSSLQQRAFRGEL